MPLDPLTPEQLRDFADVCQRKAGRLYGEGRTALAYEALAMAVELSLEANEQEAAGRSANS